MAGSQIERAVGILECLSSQPGGMALHALAEALAIPKSATHRMLTELTRLGYVRQDDRSSHYLLTSKLIAMGFRYLGNSGVDIIQPILDRLAEQTGELVRLGVIDGERLTWIAKSQGARSGLRYDPDMGREAPLFPTATGHAWLASMTDDEALARVVRQGPPPADMLGPSAPADEQALLERLRLARERGYAWVVESSAMGMSAMAAVVRHPLDGHPLGVLSVAGPTARLSETRMHELAPCLLAAAQELSGASQASELFV
ncbi:MAG: IclR family transcriptional regulator [Pseudomonas sp.]|nr:IclR family transcriptional regulator [Pseudomonadales bacterium]MAK87986.1 IclR family transcriptional regulator [Pseudomonas sp.]